MAFDFTNPYGMVTGQPNLGPIMPQPPQPTQTPNPMGGGKNDKLSLMLYALGGALKGDKNFVQSTMQLQQMQEGKRKQEEQNKLWEKFKTEHSIDPQVAGLGDMMNPNQRLELMMKTIGGGQSKDRKIIKAADGYNYYADTGKRVLPSVEKPKDKMSYNMKQDVNSYWRYTEGPMKGQRVFPDVPKEKEEKESYNIGDEDKLRDDYRSESKEFVNVRNAFGRILSVEPTAAGDLSLIFNYMKMLDPGSVVRESEYENAAQSGAFGERVKAAYLRYKSGERLTEPMREDFKTQANNLYQTQSDNQSYVMEEYKNLAEEYNMKPSRIVQNYGSPIEDKLLKIKLESMPLNELATLDPSQYSEKQLDIIAKVIKSKGKK